MKKSIIYSIGIIVSLFSLCSCEKEIDLGLDKLEPKVVVEGGIIEGQTARLQVKYTKVYTEEMFCDQIDEYSTPVRNAVVTLIENGDVEEVLQEKEFGFYEGINLKGKENSTYTLKIEKDGKTIQGSCHLSKSVKIDNVKIIKDEKGKMSMHAFWKDPQDHTNYYRLNIKYKYINSITGEKGEKEIPRIYLFSDNQFNGQQIDYIFEDNPLAAMDYYYNVEEYIIELQSIDPTVYDFLRNVRKVQEGNNGTTFMKAPGNPPTNLSDGCGGVFNAYSFTSTSIKIK
ncbi:MAG: DUF4249 domain-containing protein [Bacteroidales bacterium]